MKRVIFCIIGWVLVLGLHAQIVENMRIYTDKDCYVAGEDLWIKVSWKRIKQSSLCRDK